jgi:hypothetical protein
MQENYQFFMRTNLDSYIGKWVAICDKKIISYGKSVKDVYNEAVKKCPDKRPLITRVPEEETMIF